MMNGPRRLDPIDSAKGIGILLVVFGHAWRGARRSGLVADEMVFEAVDYAVYAFHMPLFFFLSGLLFLETLQKYRTQTLLKGRLTRLLWPMVLWSWIFFCLKLSAGQRANSPVTLADFPIIPLPPYEHLWFLWALFLIQTFLILANALYAGRLPTGMVHWAAAAGALMWAVLNPYLAVPSLIWGPMFEHFPYFLTGIGAGGLISYRPPMWAGLLCACGFVGLLWAVQGEKAAVLHSLGLVLLAWGAWLCVDCGRPGQPANPLLRMLGALGRASMVIYLTHTIFSAALRITLIKSGVDDVMVILPAAFLIGVIAPLCAGWAAQRARLTKWFGF